MPSVSRTDTLGYAGIVENASEADELIRTLKTDERAPLPERVITIQTDAFDWNCSQHITQRFTIDEIPQLLPLDELAKMKVAEKLLKSHKEVEQQSTSERK